MAVRKSTNSLEEKIVRVQENIIRIKEKYDEA